MKFSIKHEMTGRMRVHLSQNRMTYAQADILLYFLQNDKYVTCAKVYERTGDAVISYTGERSYIIQLLQGFCYEKAEVPTGLLEHSGRELNAVYQEKLIGKVLMRYVKKDRTSISGLHSLHYTEFLKVYCKRNPVTLAS